MQEIIKLKLAKIDGYDIQTCNARDLHAFLGVGSKFSDWIKGRITEYGFTEGEDYLVAKSGDQVRFGFSDFGNQKSPNPANQTRGGDRRSIDYILTVDMGKELAMVERNEKGRQIRRYFIECERDLRVCADVMGFNVREPVGFTATQRARISELINLAVEPMADKQQAKRELRRVIYRTFGSKIKNIHPDRLLDVAEVINTAGVSVRGFLRKQAEAEKTFWEGMAFPALPSYESQLQLR